MKIYLITDTHFYHDNLTTKFNERPEGFTEIVINNWKNTTTEGDLTIHLGDVTIGHDSELKEILNSIAGTKILVKGNHDRKSNHWYLTNGFSFVCDNFTLKDVLFSHEPIPKNLIPENIRLNVHGHTHGNSHRLEDWMSDDIYKEYALENEDYRPVLMQDFIDKPKH